LTHLPQKGRFADPLGPNDQDALSLTIKHAEILYQLLPAEECKTLIH